VKIKKKTFNSKQTFRKHETRQQTRNIPVTASVCFRLSRVRYATSSKY